MPDYRGGCGHWTGFCLSEAASADAVRRLRAGTGDPADEIHEITVVV